MDIDNLKQIVAESASWEEFKYNMAHFEIECTERPWEDKANSILEYLNDKVGKRLKGTIKIENRLRDGFSLDQLKSIIDLKSSEWAGNPKMFKYIHPNTLFRSKRKVREYLDHVDDVNTFHKREQEKKDMQVVRPRADWK